MFYACFQQICAAPVDTDGGFQAGTPTTLIRSQYFFGSFWRTYDVSLDGERFLMISLGGTNTAGSLRDVVMVENWFEELKRLVPTD